MSGERFVGKTIKMEVNGTEYRFKSPPAKCIPKMLAFNGKDVKTMGEKDWDILVDVMTDFVKKSYPEWTIQEIDEFIVQNFTDLQLKLIEALGWSDGKEVKGKESFLSEEKKPS